MSVWYRDITGRLTRMDQPPHHNMQGHEEKGRVCLQVQVPNEAHVHHGRHMQDYFNLTKALTSSCINLLANAHTFVIKPGMLSSLPTFHGMESESPYLHVKDLRKW